jgi:hypothetical protein
MAEVARATEVLEYREVFEETLVFGTRRSSGATSRAAERDRTTGK